jgi:hypothetical protein
MISSLVLSLLATSVASQAISCPKNCVVTAADGKTFDLSALKDQTLTTTSDNGDTYSLTLCGTDPQTCNKDTSGVFKGMAVQKQSGGDGCYVLAVYNQENVCQWQRSEPGSSADLTLVMQSGTAVNCKGQDRSLAVEMSCPADKSTLIPKSWTAVNPVGTCDYVYKIDTCAVCDGGCVGGGGGGGGSGGSGGNGFVTFLIVCLVLFCCYLFFGSLYQYKQNGKRGVEICTGLYPEKLCGYVGSGCKFVFNGCKSSENNNGFSSIDDNNADSTNSYQ